MKRLQVTCWCEARLVLVDQARVVAGRTGSCGRPGCTEQKVMEKSA